MLAESLYNIYMNVGMTLQLFSQRVMSVCFRMYTVFQQVSFVVESAETEFRNFHSIYDVIRRSEATKFALLVKANVPQNLQEVLVLNFLSHVVLLHALYLSE